MGRATHRFSKKMKSKFERFLLLFVLFGVIASMGNWAIKGLVHSLKEVVVPDLTGKTVNEALEIVSKKNLGLKKEGSEFNESVPAGTITRQKPEAGLKVREDKTVRVIVSEGGEQIVVPDLSGLSLRSAEITLRTRFLSLGEISNQFSLRFGKDKVMFQDPTPNTNVAKNSIVHVTLSEGLPPEGTLLMPDFIGKTIKEVESWSNEVKISVEKSGDAQGTVYQQEPSPDTPLSSKISVRIVLTTSQEKPETKRNNL